MEPVRLTRFDEAYYVVKALESLDPKSGVVLKCRYCDSVFEGFERLVRHLKSGVHCRTLAITEANRCVRGMPLEDEKRALHSIAYSLQSLVVERMFSGSDTCDIYRVMKDLESIACDLNRLVEYMTCSPSPVYLLDAFDYFKISTNTYVSYPRLKSWACSSKPLQGLLTGDPSVSVCR